MNILARHLHGDDRDSPAIVAHALAASAIRAPITALTNDDGTIWGIVGLFAGPTTAWGDVREGAETLELATVKHRGTITRVDDRGGGQRPVVQSPYRFSAATSGARGGSPRQGEHNAEVLADWLAFDRTTIDALRDNGVLITVDGA